MANSNPLKLSQTSGWLEFICWNDPREANTRFLLQTYSSKIISNLRRPHLPLYEKPIITIAATMPPANNMANPPQQGRNTRPANQMIPPINWEPTSHHSLQAAGAAIPRSNLFFSKSTQISCWPHLSRANNDGSTMAPTMPPINNTAEPLQCTYKMGPASFTCSQIECFSVASKHPLSTLVSAETMEKSLVIMTL